LTRADRAEPGLHRRGQRPDHPRHDQDGQLRKGARRRVSALIRICSFGSITPTVADRRPRMVRRAGWPCRASGGGYAWLMPNIQQPEMRRSGRDPLVQDSAENRAAGSAGTRDTAAPVPTDQRSSYGPRPPQERVPDGTAGEEEAHR
jgi:hypothetical protein